MKSRASFSLFGLTIQAGEEIHPAVLYPFFLVHMAAFGVSGFLMAYSSEGPDLFFLYLHGGVAVAAYVSFYLAAFGADEVRWMFINAALGLLGISVEIDAILSRFGKSVHDFPPWVHVVPFLYYVLYTFLLRQLVLDVFGARDKPARKQWVERGYVAASLLVYGGTWLLAR